MRHCYYGTFLDFRIHKFCELEAKQLLFSIACSYLNILGHLTSAKFDEQFPFTVVAKLCLVLSPGGPQSSWIKSDDILQDKEG